MYHNSCHHARLHARRVAPAVLGLGQVSTGRIWYEGWRPWRRSHSAPAPSRLVEDLTCVLQVPTFYGNAGRRQHGAWSAGAAAGTCAVLGSGADTVPWSAVAGWVSAARAITLLPRPTVAGAHPMLSSSVPRRMPCCLASITAPHAYRRGGGRSGQLHLLYLLDVISLVASSYGYYRGQIEHHTAQ